MCTLMGIPTWTVPHHGLSYVQESELMHYLYQLVMGYFLHERALSVRVGSPEGIAWWDAVGWITAMEQTNWLIGLGLIYF